MAQPQNSASASGRLVEAKETRSNFSSAKAAGRRSVPRPRASTSAAMSWVVLARRAACAVGEPGAEPPSLREKREPCPVPSHCSSVR
eukprot:4045646-Pleurochrysis_carterae.AAC.1